MSSDPQNTESSSANVSSFGSHYGTLVQLELEHDGLELRTQVSSEHLKILTPQALRFVAALEKNFGPKREQLLADRIERQALWDERSEGRPSHLPHFLNGTAEVRAADWKVAPIPFEIINRRVEITGPVDRKTVINAMNSGANVFMADFEDSHSPVWKGTLDGQVNLYDAVRGDMQHTQSDGKVYRLNRTTAQLFVRPRGWHLVEKGLFLKGRPVSASLFDFGLYFFHNARELIDSGHRPFFYLPKMESHLEARLWNSVFEFAQREMGLPNGTLRATVLIETLPAAFEMDEILFELRDHSAGLNCGRWDYIFSTIKKLKAHPEFVLPDRALVTMEAPFLKAYCQLLIKTCHRRGIHAMGGMAAQIPIKDDPERNRQALERVRLDKVREVKLGHDGTWVAHPGLIATAKQAFDEVMPQSHQIFNKRSEWSIQESDLLALPQGGPTPEGIRANISISLLYLESWLRGVGCVPIRNLMEDAATAEISRSQLWQWIRHGKLTWEDFQAIFQDELTSLRLQMGEAVYQKSRLDLAARVLLDITGSHQLAEFLTLTADQYL